MKAVILVLCLAVPLVNCQDGIIGPIVGGVTGIVKNVTSLVDDVVNGILDINPLIKDIISNNNLNLTGVIGTLTDIITKSNITGIADNAISGILETVTKVISALPGGLGTAAACVGTKLKDLVSNQKSFTSCFSVLTQLFPAAINAIVLISNLVKTALDFTGQIVNCNLNPLCITRIVATAALQLLNPINLVVGAVSAVTQIASALPIIGPLICSATGLLSIITGALNTQSGILSCLNKLK